MVKEIAIYLNEYDEINDLNEVGIINIFYKEKDQWKISKKVPFKFNSTEKVEDIRLDSINIMEALGNCKIFVAREFSDLIYKVLDSMGFSIWKMEGNLNEVLDYVFEKEEEEAEEIKLIESLVSIGKEQDNFPVKIGNSGYYILNIKELQEHNLGVSTKQVLRPFLKNMSFVELIVICSHIPNWIKTELEELNFKYRILESGDTEYIIIISRANT